MIRVAVVPIILLLGGCGSGGPRAEAASSSARKDGGSQDRRPVAAPPHSPASVAPPPAWVHTDQGSRWLAFDSYCWSVGSRGVCADMAGADQRRDVPTVVVSSGTTLRFHLAFAAQSADIYLGRISSHSVLHSWNTRAIAWRAPSRRGDLIVLLDVHTQGTGESAGYLARVRIR